MHLLCLLFYFLQTFFSVSDFFFTGTKNWRTTKTKKVCCSFSCTHLIVYKKNPDMPVAKKLKTVKTGNFLLVFQVLMTHDDDYQVYWFILFWGDFIPFASFSTENSTRLISPNGQNVRRKLLILLTTFPVSFTFYTLLRFILF